MKRLLFAALAAILFVGAGVRAQAQVAAPAGQLKLDKSWRICDENGDRLTAEQRTVYLNLDENKAFRQANFLEVPAYLFSFAGGGLFGWNGYNMIREIGEKDTNLTMMGVGAGCIAVGAFFDYWSKIKRKKVVRSYNARLENEYEVSFRWGATPSGFGLALQF